jgi:3-oxoacyl-[acyl-carrier protein] reductase
MMTSGMENGSRVGRLAGKVAIVTGASQGIGAAIALRLAADGASVVVNHRASAEKAEAVVKAIRADGGAAIAVQADVSRPVDAKRLVDETVAHFGRIDTLVNNAGVFQYAELADISEDSFHHHFNVNVLGVILAVQAARPHLIESQGSIINIGSAASRALPATTTIYSATKAAVDALTKTLAKELGPRNVRINTIAPGAVRTQGVIDAGLLGGDWENFLVAHTPLGRIAETDDIAPVVAFFASDDARWITGETLFLSGGS